MLGLPDGFSLLDFEECSMFACQILLDQILAENGFEANHGSLTVEEVEKEFPRLAEYITLQIEQGISVAYYYYLVKYFPDHYECQDSYKNVIVDCEGASSKITELPSVYLSGDEGIKTSSIGVTAHEAVFLHVRDIYNAIEEFCFKGDESEPSIDVIKDNISLIKKQSAYFFIDTHDAQRTACEMNRELLLVTGQYEREQGVAEVPSSTNPKIDAKRSGESRALTHENNFSLIHYNGETYRLSRLRAACFKVMWENQSAGRHPMKDIEIITEASEESSTTRLRDVFKDQPIYGEVIIDVPNMPGYRKLVDF